MLSMNGPLHKTCLGDEVKSGQYNRERWEKQRRERDGKEEERQTDRQTDRQKYNDGGRTNGRPDGRIDG